MGIRKRRYRDYHEHRTQKRLRVAGNIVLGLGALAVAAIVAWVFVL
jgi:hypothetical protein